MLLMNGKLELASYCVCHAAELNATLGGSATQQAIVQTFLKNYNKAIGALETAVKSSQTQQLYSLLGRIKMKAAMWKSAVDSFTIALDIVNPWNQSKMPSSQPQATPPAEAAEMYYLIGLCLIECKQYSEACDAFNNTLKIESKHAEAFYQRALCRFKLGQNKAILDLNKSLSIDPTLFQAYLSRATYYGMRGRYTKAIMNCNEAIVLQPRSIRAYLYRGALKFYIKAFRLAIDDLSTAISLDTKCLHAYFNRALCHHQNNNWLLALKDYGIVLILGDSLQLSVFVNRGLLYFDRKDFRNALADLSHASKLSPHCKYLHHTMGLCYHRMNKLLASIESYEVCIDIDPLFIHAHIGKANTSLDLTTTESFTKSRRGYERVILMYPSNTMARVNLAFTLQISGKFQQAWHQLSAAILLDPKCQAAYEARAVICLQMKNIDASFQDINKALKISNSAELLTNRGVIYQYMKDNVNAMTDYQHAIQLDDTYSLAYFNAANIYFHSRRFKQAKVYYKSATQFNKNDESAYLNSAITKAMLKDSKGALQDFKRSIELCPHYSHAYLNRGNLYTEMKQYDLADKDYTLALEKLPDDAHIYIRRAEVRGHMGHKADAIADYRRAINIQSMSPVSI